MQRGTSSRHYVTLLPTAAFISALGLLLFSFRDAIGVIAQSWGKEEYSHGSLILLLSLLLTLNKMSTLPAAKADRRGVLLLFSGITTQFFFQFAGVNGLSPQFLLLSLIGTIIAFYGMAITRALWGALGLLFFAVPLPKLFFYTLSFNMQRASTDLGAWFLSMLHIPVFQDGNIIDLGGYQLEVAEACNGIHYLFPLLGLSFLLAYLFRTATWKRVLLFVSALPITVAMNGLRIAVIGITVDQWGLAMAKGFVHEAEGWLVFIGCSLLLMAEIVLLRRFAGDDPMAYEELQPPSLRHWRAPAIGKARAMIVILIIAAMISFLLPSYLSQHRQPVPLAQSLNDFPMQIDAWHGTTHTLSKASLDVLGTDDYLVADYANGDAAPVNLYLLYYQQQDSSSNEAVHSPSVCIPAGGWEIVARDRKHISLGDRPTLGVNRLLITKGLMRQIVYYWFIEEDGETPDPSLSRLATIKNAIIKGRTNGALVRLTSLVNDKEDDTQAEKRLKAFLYVAHPSILQRLFPSQTNEPITKNYIRQ